MSEDPHFQCSNCLKSIDLDLVYCPYCGQKNRRSRLPFMEFLHEFIATVLNIDNKFFLTLASLFFPARLTKEYFKGKRKKYYHPLRVYITSIIVFFFVLSFVRPEHFINSQNGEVSADLEEELDALDSLNVTYNFSINGSDEVQGRKWTDFLASFDFKEKQELSEQAIYFRDVIEQFKGKEKFSQDTVLIDSLFRSLFFIAAGDTLWLKSLPDTSRFTITNPILKKSYHLTEKERFYDDISEVAKKYEPDSYFNRLFLQFEIRAMRDFTSFLRGVYANLLWLFIALAPIFALILKLFYIFKQRFYIEHFVFILHILTALIIIASLTLLGLRMMEVKAYAWTFFGLSIFFYPLFAFQRFYKQFWFITFLKYLFIGVFFFSATIICMVIFFFIAGLLIS